MDAPKASRSNRVTVAFQDATLIDFDFDPEMSLGELAVRIGKVARPRGGLSLPVHVRLAAARGCNNGQPPQSYGFLTRREYGAGKRATTFAGSSLAS
jgi:hypothetical protein